MTEYFFRRYTFLDFLAKFGTGLGTHCMSDQTQSHHHDILDSPVKDMLMLVVATK
jgi:hypothetical protein